MTLILENKDITSQMIDIGVFNDKMFDYPIFIKKLKNSLENRLIIGFHNTRIYNEEEYLKDGIKCLNFEEHLNRLERDLKNYGIDLVIIEEALNKIKNHMNYDDNKELKQGKINLYVSKNKGYEKFSEFYGGEIVEWSFTEDEKEDRFKFFKEMGVPRKLKLSFNFDYVIDIYQDNILGIMVANVVNNKIYNTTYKVEVDIKLNRDVSSSNILKIRTKYIK